MPTLQIEHPVPDFDAWKKAFDSDPLGRERSGVRSYRILRPVGEPRQVIVELEFDELPPAEAMLAKLHELWRGVDVMRAPRARILETCEARNLGGRGDRG